MLTGLATTTTTHTLGPRGSVNDNVYEVRLESVVHMDDSCRSLLFLKAYQLQYTMIFFRLAAIALSGAYSEFSSQLVISSQYLHLLTCKDRESKVAGCS